MAEDTDTKRWTKLLGILSTEEAKTYRREIREKLQILDERMCTFTKPDLDANKALVEEVDMLSKKVVMVQTTDILFSA